MNRRQFIKRGALFVTGAVAFPNIVRANSLPATRLQPFFRKKRKKAGGGGGSFTYSLISHTIATVDGTATGDSSSIDTTGANLFIYSLAWFSGTPTITDSKGNSAPTGLTQRACSTDGVRFTRLYYETSPSVGSGHVFHIACSNAGYCVLCVAAFQKSSGTPTFDVQNGFDQTGGSSSTAQPGSVTPAGDNELIVTGICTNGNRPFTIDSGFSISDQGETPTATLAAGGLAYLIQTTGGAVNPTWQAAGTFGVYPCTIAAFK